MAAEIKVAVRQMQVTVTDASRQYLQQDFAAGSLSSHALVIIVVAIAVVLVVILATKL